MTRPSWIPAAVVVMACSLGLAGAGPAVATPQRDSPNNTPVAQVETVSPAALAAARGAGLVDAVALLDRLPAYAGAQMISAPPYVRVNFHHLVLDAAGIAEPPLMPALSDLVDVYREWRAPAGEPRVAAWVKSEAATQGLYRMGGKIPVGTGDTITGVDFGLTRRAEYPALDVDMRPLDAAHTLVRYDAVLIWQPPRPPGEFVPYGPASVTVQALAGPVPVQVVASTVVHGDQEMAALVSLINNLPPDTRGPHGCPAETGTAMVAFVFHYRSTPTLTVEAGYCGGASFTSGSQSRYPELYDPQCQLWSVAASIVGKAAEFCRVPPAPPAPPA